MRGLAHAKLDQYQAALDDLKKAIDLNAEDGQAYFFKGSVHYEQNELQRACRAWQGAINRGSKQAMRYFTKVCRKQPSQPQSE